MFKTSLSTKTSKNLILTRVAIAIKDNKVDLSSSTIIEKFV